MLLRQLRPNQFSYILWGAPQYRVPPTLSPEVALFSSSQSLISEMGEWKHIRHVATVLLEKPHVDENGSR